MNADAIARYLNEPNSNDELMHWLESNKNGRVYIGNLLLQIHSLTPTERGTFERAGGFAGDLKIQYAALQSLGFSLSEQIQKQLRGKLCSEILRYGAGDKRCPKPLRDWLAQKVGLQKEIHKIATRYWLGNHVQAKLQREAFETAVCYLTLSKRFAAYVKNYDARQLSRVLVNHLQGDAGRTDFQKGPKELCRFIGKFFKSGRKTKARKYLKLLLSEKLKSTERKTAPATRLKQALEALFRLLRKYCSPSGEFMVKDAFRSMPPWAKEREAGKHGDAKPLAYRISNHAEAAGVTLSISNAQRYLQSCISSKE